MRVESLTRLARELHRASLLAGLPDPATRQAIRERAGVSQRALGAAIGCTQSTISKWEDGTQLPRGDTLTAYVIALQALARAVEDGRLGETVLP